MWVNIYVVDQRKWVESVIDKIHNSAAQIGQYNVVAKVLIDGEEVIPCTINKHNQDPIPNIRPGHPIHNISGYIRERDTSMYGLLYILSKHMECFK